MDIKVFFNVVIELLEIMDSMEVIAISYQHIHMRSRASVVKAARALGATAVTSWDSGIDSYPVQTSFVYNGWQIFSINTEEAAAR